MTIKLLSIILLGISLSSCSSPGHFSSDSAEPTKAVKPDEPKPTPTPPKKPEFHTRCKISNNEGRIFTAMDDDQDMAEAKALRECKISYRHCTILDCSLTTEED